MSIRTAIDHGIGRLVLAHPPLNILTRAVLAEIRAALARWAGDQALRVLLLEAEGKHFSAGADVGEHLPPHHRSLIPEFLETVAALEAFALPVIAAVRGRCLGGGFELIQPADIVVAGEGATFGQPEIQLGVFPPAACAMLPGRCPPGAAAELVLTGDPVDAREAERLGLVRRVVPDAEVERVALELAQRVARHSRPALVLAKRALVAGAGRRRTALQAVARLYLDDLMATEDAVEGLTAFLEKRAPAWSHR